jgi:hypothetical protein
VGQAAELRGELVQEAREPGDARVARVRRGGAADRAHADDGHSEPRHPQGGGAEAVDGGGEPDPERALHNHVPTRS